MRPHRTIALIAVCMLAAGPGGLAQAQQWPSGNNGGWGNGNGSNNGGWGGNNGGWNNGAGGNIRCESWNYRYARCNADTAGGVRLSRVIAGDCRKGRSWGYSRGYIWVNRGCRAEFETRNGNNAGNNGPSTGAVIAGVAVAAGLLALLASKGRKADPAKTSPQSATINIGSDVVPRAAQPAFRQCVEEAARQIGATGGKSIRLLGSVDASQRGNDWQFQLPLEASWPDDTHPAPATCRASSAKLIDLSFQPS
ncbi:DUF3011 domain-containing protein [Sandarakinorhabdus sp.]|uniref:DUF3011 domain-containing protein n=1 Tax=Sandarakinorhabdus sp. TaxID=1916663 RepID=UPI003F6F93C2